MPKAPKPPPPTLLAALADDASEASAPPFARATVKLYVLRQAWGSKVTRSQVAAYNRVLTSLGVDPLGTEPLSTVTVRQILARHHIYRARALNKNHGGPKVTLRDLLEHYRQQ